MKKLLLFSFVLQLFVLCVSAQAVDKYSFERYLNIRGASSPTFSADGSKIAFLTNITGTSQIWLIDANGGFPEQLTAYQDNVGFVQFSPKGDGILFGKAKGGDENTQLFWMSPDGAEVKPLTDSPKVRHNFGGWSKDGAKIYYSSNRRNKDFFDVYSMEIASGKEETILLQDGSNSFAAASDNGNSVIISRSGETKSLDNNLYLVNLAKKETTLLTAHDDASQFGEVHFMNDGKTFLLGSNKGREFYSLAQMNYSQEQNLPVKPMEIGIVDNSNWDLDATAVTADASMVAYTINREGFNEFIYLRNLNTGGKPFTTFVDVKSQVIQLPAKGIVSGLEFSPDKSKIAFTFNNATNNSDIWTYNIWTKKFTQVTKSSRVGIPQKSFVEPELIRYKSFDGKEITAWYYKPNLGFQVDGIMSLPVIVSVHGGPEGQERPSFNPLYQYYLSRGYAVLATNVRGSTGFGKTFTHLDDVRQREDSVKDLAYSVEWLKKSGGADPKRIAVMGGSYGGYMTLAAITLYPELWAAAVDTVGIANWESFLKNTSGYRRKQREVEYGSLDKDLDFLRSISPLAKVDKIKCPLFVIQGKNDPRVPYTEAEQIVDALKKRGATVEYKLFDDEGHGISKLKNRLELYPLVADFLDKNMK